MTDEEIKALKDKLSQLEADVKVKDEKLAKSEADKTTTVQELQDLRSKKQEVEAELTLLKSKIDKSEPQGNVEEQVNKILADRDAKKIKDVRATIDENFKKAHSEFHPDNDTGGIKYAAFQDKLKRINLDSLKSEEEIWDAYEDTLFVMNKGKNSSETTFNPYAATKINTSGEPRGQDNNKLSSTEIKLIEQLGWTEERYLKVKKSQPHYVETMLTRVK